MGKMATMLTIMGGLMVLFYVTGITSNSGNNAFLSYLLNPSSIFAAGSSLSIKFVTAAMALTTIGGFILGLLYMNPQLIVMGGLISVFIGFAWDFMIVVNAIINVDPVVGMLIFSPFLLLFGITTIEFWRGGD